MANHVHHSNGCSLQVYRIEFLNHRTINGYQWGKPHGQKPKVRISKILVVFVVILIVVLGLAASLYYSGRDKGGPEPVNETADKTSESFIPPFTVVPGVEPSRASRVPVAKDVCKENQEKLKALFAYLDRQDYIASRQFKGGSFEIFQSLLTRLLDTPPSVLLETNSILHVLQNRAHFYRVLGRKDTLLLRDILLKEGDILESSFAILYQAMVFQEKCRTDGPVMHVPPREVYPYTVLFLNTLGGASYLMRRDSRVRMLTRYYCILILDQANRGRYNNLGLDIRQPLNLLMEEMKSATNLSRKEEYLDTLKSIRAGY